jgi:hypothetical protein
MIDDSEERSVAGKAYFASSGKGARALCFNDDRTFALGQEHAVRRYLALDRLPAGAGRFRDVDELATHDHPIVGSFRPSLDQAKDLRQKMIPEDKRFLGFFLQAQSASLTATTDRSFSVQIKLTYASENEGSTAAARFKVAQKLSNLPNPSIESFRRLTPDLLMREMIQFAEVKQAGPDVHLTVRSPVSSVAAIAVPTILRTFNESAAMSAMGNLKQLSLAILNYDADHGRFPPANITNAQGRPLLSWRVAVLPYLDQLDIYRAFKLDEPWDSEHNKKLLTRMPSVLKPPPRNGSTQPYTTCYRVFTGPGTAFNEKNRTTFEGLADAVASTFEIVEVAESVPWTKPDELIYDAGKPLPKLGGHFSGCFLASFCDASVLPIRNDARAEDLKLLITRDKRKSIDREVVHYPADLDVELER